MENYNGKLSVWENILSIFQTEEGLSAFEKKNFVQLSAVSSVQCQWYCCTLPSPTFKPHFPAASSEGCHKLMLGSLELMLQNRHMHLTPEPALQGVCFT